MEGGFGVKQKNAKERGGSGGRNGGTGDAKNKTVWDSKFSGGAIVKLEKRGGKGANYCKGKTQTLEWPISDSSKKQKIREVGGESGGGGWKSGAVTQKLRKGAQWVGGGGGQSF